jgi:carboxynorspermidine decarboxylase
MNRPSFTEILRDFPILTPAYVYDEQRLIDNISRIRSSLQGHSVKLLYAMKAFSVRSALQQIIPMLDGLHASSLFEARLARELLGEKGIVHITCPGLQEEELEQITANCTFLSFNSLSQWQYFQNMARGKVFCGLRINPEISFVEDARYNPCRICSKLGFPLKQLQHTLQHQPDLLQGISGLLIHTNCDCEDLEPLKRTVDHLVASLHRWLPQLSWVDLGGGYLFNSSSSAPLQQALDNIRHHFDGQIIIEPGAAIARSAVALVATIRDIITSSNPPIAVLDTSVNHLPEVFEYQFEPELEGNTTDGKFMYLLAGCTCLAGDIFGHYSFSEPLRLGARLIFKNIGAYSQVKAHMFNGINLPSIYAVTKALVIKQQRRFRYSDYLSLTGG